MRIDLSLLGCTLELEEELTSGSLDEDDSNEEDVEELLLTAGVLDTGSGTTKTLEDDTRLSDELLLEKDEITLADEISLSIDDEDTETLDTEDTLTCDELETGFWDAGSLLAGDVGVLAPPQAVITAITEANKTAFRGTTIRCLTALLFSEFMQSSTMSVIKAYWNPAFNPQY